MSAHPPAFIRLRGVRQNNLKNINLDLPLGRLIVFAGLSGSGKSSLAFDTLFAEGQRRYVETFSPYARQFLDRMDKPQADSIEGIPPAIAIEQRNSVKSTRSTVGTMTEIADFAKLLWPALAQIHCRNCGAIVRKDPPQLVWKQSLESLPGEEIVVTFGLPLSDKFPVEESLALVGRQGYRRLLLDGKIALIEEAALLLQASPAAALTIIQDKVKLAPANRSRFVDACEQAYHFGKGLLAVRRLDHDLIGAAVFYSNKIHCAACDLVYTEPSPALFSFNHPLGACPACRGFGRIIAINYDAAIPDRSKTLAGGAVKPWQTASNAECQGDLMKWARKRKTPVDIPFQDLSKAQQDWVVNGDPDHGKDDAHRWPKSWYGVKGYFRWLESRAYKMHVRVLLSRYRIYQPCPACGGARFQPGALLYRLRAGAQTEALTIADFYRLPVSRAREWIDEIARARPRVKGADPLALALEETRARLAYLEEVGLGYLTLDRQTRTLSGGETERVNLTACLGSRLVNTLFVLDEPTVGLHPRDTERLVRILRRLREAGNTVVVVEHEPLALAAAEQIVELGPGHGETGGEVVFQGSFPEILRSARSLTGQYLSGRKRIPLPARRPVDDSIRWLVARHARLHNLRDLTVRLPLGRFVCVTGVSGSGKSTLVRELIAPSLQAHFAAPSASAPGEDGGDIGDSPAGAAALQIEGWQALAAVAMVDQSSLGRTPRSNPAVYIGAFDEIRELFAQSEPARRRGLKVSAFSFNSTQGQCERCRGAGFEKIEMQFLSDIFIRCPDCDGRRYRPHILQVKVRPPGGQKAWGIGDLLDATVDETIRFLEFFPESRPARRAGASLRLLQETGLGYLRTGQPINTLSGGESQRLKLVSHLTQIDQAKPTLGIKPTLFIFDEPTTGLHFEDIVALLKVFQRLVDVGHSVLVVEHNLEVIKCADWLVDLGPEAGDGGGAIVAEGTPETVAANPKSHTGTALSMALTLKLGKKVSFL